MAIASYDPRSEAVTRLRFDPAQKTLLLGSEAREVKAKRGKRKLTALAVFTRVA